MSSIVDEADFPAAGACSYLDAANIALMYTGAESTIVDWQRDVAAGGSLTFDDRAEAEVFDRLHAAAARLFGTQPTDIAVGSSATELLSSLAWAVAPASGTNVVGTDVVFPSTIYPWRRVANHTGAELRLARGRDGRVSPEDIIRLIDRRTAVVCISHVEYGSGQRFDLTRLAEAAHGHGALLVVDATQSAGAIPIDAPGAGIDAIVCAGYKWLCGPFGAAVMYLAPPLHTELEPGLVGFRSHEDMWDLRADRLTHPPTARRFEFSTMAYGCALGLARSIEFLLGVGVERIHEHNQLLADRLVEGLSGLGVGVGSALGDAGRSSIVTARVEGRDGSEIERALKQRAVVASSRGDALRFSPHLYNDGTDIDRALECLQDAL